MYGAQLIEALRRCTGRVGADAPSTISGQAPLRPADSKSQLDFFGVGGEKMRACGCETVVNAKDLSVVGITEILSHLPKIWGLFNKRIAQADQRKPGLAIVIDSPAFNWRVARKMNNPGFSAVYVLCPQAAGCRSVQDYT